MFCRTKTVKKLIDELKAEIKELKEEVKEAKKEPEMFYGEATVPVRQIYLWSSLSWEREKVKISFVVEQILAHLGMEIVKEPKKDEKFIVRKKPKAQKGA